MTKLLPLFIISSVFSLLSSQKHVEVTFLIKKRFAYVTIFAMAKNQSGAIAALGIVSQRI